VSFRSLLKFVPVVVVGLALASPTTAAGSRLVVPRLGLDVPVAKQLEQGPRIYYRDADTIAVAGHRTTYTRPFRRLPALRPGDVVRLGRTAFRVKRTVIVRPWEVWILRWRGLVLSACHPAGSAAYRFVVLARPLD
jgi:sortase (surface protein transpeptidase)